MVLSRRIERLGAVIRLVEVPIDLRRGCGRGEHRGVVVEERKVCPCLPHLLADLPQPEKTGRGRIIAPYGCGERPLLAIECRPHAPIERGGVPSAVPQ